MKKTFYGVVTESYRNGKRNAAIISRICKEKPNSTSRKNEFLDAAIYWYDTEDQAVYNRDLFLGYKVA